METDDTLSKSEIRLKQSLRRDIHASLTFSRQALCAIRAVKKENRNLYKDASIEAREKL